MIDAARAMELGAMLRPAGGGVHLVSTGRAEQLALQRALYGVADDADVARAHDAALARIAQAKVVILGVPSDVGAGFRRGANLGPAAIRRALHADAGFAAYAARAGIVDIGDVFCVPQLLHDEMLAPAQIDASRSALYADVPRTVRRRLPVSPLSMAERVLDHVLALQPAVVPVVLGGDHSVAWPVTAALARARPGFGIVQIDAHTDLLESRLGVRYCFATWTFHANDVVGRGGRVVQVGIRASGRDRAHWESSTGVRQFWAAECLADPSRALDDIVRAVEKSGVREIYFSNDIDGTDARWADATGTPEPGGLEPDFVLALIDRLAQVVRIGAADVVEVAPPLSPTTTTVELAARYLRASLDAITRP